MLRSSVGCSGAKRLAPLLLSIGILCVGNTVDAYAAYTTVDVDAWDYERSDALEDQISVQGDVEYEPPADLKGADERIPDVDYSNQLEQEEEEVVKTSEPEVVSEPAVTTELQSEGKSSSAGVIVCIVIAIVIAALITMKKVRQHGKK